jgi:cell wall-associated NlpC family hydrolase
MVFVMVLLSCNSNTEQTREVWIVDSLSAIQSHFRKDSSLHIKADSLSAIQPHFQQDNSQPIKVDSTSPGKTRDIHNKLPPPSTPAIHTGTATPGEVMRFAETLIGVPYKWASTDPKVGFDCSGFITYVFTHFNIRVPRSSIDFTHVGKTVPVDEAKRGDIILFTGTNSMETDVGHMGLVVSNEPGGLQFIHSTSGKAMSVTVSKFNEQYKKRFNRISRVFLQNE